LRALREENTIRKMGCALQNPNRCQKREGLQKSGGGRGQEANVVKAPNWLPDERGVRNLHYCRMERGQWIIRSTITQKLKAAPEGFRFSFELAREGGGSVKAGLETPSTNTENWIEPDIAFLWGK